MGSAVGSSWLLPAGSGGMGVRTGSLAKRPRYEKTRLSCPSVFTAVREQLGLRLDARRAPVPVLVIDSVQPPIPD